MKQMLLTIDILNYGLELSMDFGENWLQPINERLSSVFPNLSAQKLEECHLICKTVNKMGNRYVQENPVHTGTEITFIAFEAFEKFMLNKYHWVSAKNLKRLYSQICYYAYK